MEEKEKIEESTQEVEKQETEENKLQKEYEELDDRYKRMMAEFDNYKKRSQKERENLYNSLVSDIITSFLPIVDNLEKAVNVKTQDEAYKQGVEMVQKQFMDTLRALGVEEIKSVGEVFNPEEHEAISSIEDETLGEKIVKEEYRKGYKIGGKVIRHSMVVVAN